MWGARQLAPSLSLSARLNGEIWQNIRGADAALGVMDEPTKDPALQGGKRLDVVVGMTVQPNSGILKGQQFFVQGEVPVAQSLDGPQLRRRWAVRIGSQWEF